MPHGQAIVTKLTAGDGHKDVTGFKASRGDKVMFIIEPTWSDILFIGPVSDGYVHTSSTGGATFTFTGTTDTTVTTVRTADGQTDSITLVGVVPDTLTGAQFEGG